MLIAEIGNNHFGSMEKAKELIRVAKECGADVVKGQAFDAKDITTGSMHHDFYEMCSMSLDQNIELFSYAYTIGIDMFFSVFSDGFEELERLQKYQKISGGQFEHFTAEVPKGLDDPSFIISVQHGSFWKVKNWKKANFLFVTPYMTEKPMLSSIKTITEITGRQTGLSDHCMGIGHAIRAAEEYGANIIEKHFCLEKNVIFGSVYRDTVHAADPKELEKLSRELNKIWKK